MSFSRYLCLLAYMCPTHIVFCLCFAFLRLVYPMLPVSLNCPFLFPLRYSLTFIYLQCAGQFAKKGENNIQMKF
jgi:hypothetical protein